MAFRVALSLHTHSRTRSPVLAHSLAGAPRYRCSRMLMVVMVEVQSKERPRESTVRYAVGCVVVVAVGGLLRVRLRSFFFLLFQGQRVERVEQTV